MKPITFDAQGVFRSGLSQTELDALVPRLNEAREEVLRDVELLRSRSPIPTRKVPLDSGFIDLPNMLLDSHAKNSSQSELGRIMLAAQELRERVDQVVVVGIGGSYMGARAIFEACCHTYHNELPRARRNGAPRLYFDGHNVDNDPLRDLIDLLASSSAPSWGLVVISKSGSTLEPAIVFRTLMRELEAVCGSTPVLLPELLIPVTGKHGNLRNFVESLGCQHVFDVPEGVGGRYSVLSTVGLLPAAILGLDIEKFLGGAAFINERFRSAPIGSNPVLDYTATCHLMESHHGCTSRVLAMWGKKLEATGLWYDQLLSESLGKEGKGATPITVVNTRDLHSRGQQHQDGRRDKLITNVIVESPHRDPLYIGRNDKDYDQLNALMHKSVPEIMAAATLGTNAAYNNDHRPTADIQLPRLDESSMGQLFQMLMLATALEGRLIDVNPYGQPGVEEYKTQMNAILKG